MPVYLAAILSALALALAPSAAAGPLRYLDGDPADARATLHGPVLLLGGGGPDVGGALQAAIDAVRGCSGGDCAAELDVLVLRASGEDGYNDYLLAMQGVDSVETLVFSSREQASEAAVIAAVRAADFVFFAGGDQCDYVRLFRGTPLQAAVESVHARGGAVGGTSAGMAILGAVVYDACGGSATSAEVLADPWAPSATLTRGFFAWRWMEGTLTDQHFAARDRMGRLLGFLARALQESGAPRLLGVAADEQTSIVVGPDGLATVHGNPGVASAAWFVLAEGAGRAGAIVQPGTPLTWEGFRIWRVEAGRSFDLANRPGQGHYGVSVRAGVPSTDPYRAPPGGGGSAPDS